MGGAKQMATVTERSPESPTLPECWTLLRQNGSRVQTYWLLLEEKRVPAAAAEIEHISQSNTAHKTPNTMFSRSADFFTLLPAKKSPSLFKSM